MDPKTKTLLSKIASIAPAALHEVRRSPDGSFIMHSATADIEKIYGLTPAELAQDFSRAWALIHPDDHSAILAAIDESSRTLSQFRCEWRVQHPSKGEIWVVCQSTPERLPDGSIAWYGYFHDITDSKRLEHALHESQRSLTTLIDNLPGVVYRCRNDRDWTTDFVSSGVTDLTGYTPEQILSNEVTFGEITHPHDREPVWEITQKALSEGTHFKIEYRLIAADGREKWVWEQGCGIYGPDGQVLALEGFISDITERKQADEHIALLSFALNHVQEAAYLIDIESRFLYVNDEACHALGYNREELLKLGVVDIDPGFPIEHWRKHWTEIAENGSVSLETFHQRKNGEIFPVEVSANHFAYNGEGYNLALVRDITARKQQERHIEYLAYHDYLTGLPNRSLIMERLEQALVYTRRHERALAVLFIDLDRFKTINDTLGHSIGDMLLKQVGMRFVSAVRKDDTVGRIGGDEFLILLSDLADPGDSLHVIEKIHASLSAPFLVDDREFFITASIGVSLYPRDADTAETLVRYADNALYLAKEEGRNTFRFFSPELDLKTHERLHMESDLRVAGERGEFFLHYQPQIELASGVISGVEALIRWQHPTKGLIAPDKFIPIAEDIGLIIPIGEWVLRTACQQARAWHLAGIPGVRVGINLSQRQLEQHEFAERVGQILEETGCDPNILELEITESCIMAHPEQSIAKLQTLHDMGINIALDDFGTGYSSLDHLKRLPLDSLKIDQSFVSGIPSDNHDMAIIQATIVLARQLGLSVIAEGVETDEQKVFLTKHGCDEMQGYLLSKPVPAEELDKLFQHSYRQATEQDRSVE